MEKKLLQQLSVQRKVLIAFYAVTIAAYVVAIVSVLVDLTVSLWIVNFTTLFYLFGVRRLDRLYNRAFAKANLNLGSARNMMDVQVQNKGLITRQELEQQALFPTKSEGEGILCGLGMTACQGEQKIRVCEITLYYPLPKSAAKRKVSLLDGVWLEIALPKDTGLHLVLVGKQVIDDSLYPSFYEKQNLKKIPLPEKIMRQEYDLFGRESDTEQARQFARQCMPLTDCARKNGNGLLVQIHSDRVCAFLNRKSLTFSTSIREAVTAEVIQWDRLPELALLSAIGEYWSDRQVSPVQKKIG